MDVKLYKAEESLWIVFPFQRAIEKGRHIAIHDKALESLMVCGRASKLSYLGTKSLTYAGQFRRDGFVQYGKDPGVYTPPAPFAPEGEEFGFVSEVEEISDNRSMAGRRKIKRK